MKGIIDYTIKRKDGTIETGREHNVIFDLQAEAIKRAINCPWKAYVCNRKTDEGAGLDTRRGFTASRFGEFSLSEEEVSLTEPSFVPRSLITTSSSSTNWWIAPRTTTTEDKKLINQATWTVASPMRLKSIFYDYLDYVYDYDKEPHALLSCDASEITYSALNDRYHVDINFANFKFTNNSAGGLRNGDQIPNASYSDYRIPFDYDLANNSEQFAVLEAGDVITYLGSSKTNKIGIFDKTTRSLKRSFLLTQFTDFATTGQYWANVCIVRSSTKNWLLQNSQGGTSSASTSWRMWQIPDVQSDAQIVSHLITLPVACNWGTIRAIDNYLVLGASSSVSASAYIVQVLDDGTLKSYSGYSNGAALATTNSCKPMNGKSMFGSYNSSSPLAGLFAARLFAPNITAANFSTPIALAAGDTLTIIYTIEVA